jgi:hypothetical protein
MNSNKKFKNAIMEQTQKPKDIKSIDYQELKKTPISKFSTHCKDTHPSIDKNLKQTLLHFKTTFYYKMKTIHFFSGFLKRDYLVILIREWGCLNYCKISFI